MKAWEFLAERKRWTQRVAARDAQGNETAPVASDAVAFDILSGIFKAYDDITEGLRARDRLIALLVSKDYHPSVSRYNDNHTHEQVIAILKEADV